MPTALAISPHLDDAIFSAGGTLARLAFSGWRVIIATVFTASVPNPRGFALACQLDKGLAADIDYMALRREEDAVACGGIHAEPVWLPFTEAPHRNYSSASALFAGLRDDDGIVCEIEPALRELIASHTPDLIFGPQAIGAHVDHIAVYEALRSTPYPITLWTDFPYASRTGNPRNPFDEIASFNEEKIDLTHREDNAKRAAISAYASQLGFQFGGIDKIDAALGEHGGTERFRLRPPQG